MKKLLLSVAVIATMGLASCGGPSVCDCAAEEPGKASAGCTEAAAERLEAMKTASDEQKKEWMDEAKACKKEEKH